MQDAKLQMFAERDNPEKFNNPDTHSIPKPPEAETYELKLSIDGQNIIDWFKEQFGRLRQAARPHIKPQTKQEMNQGKGIKM